MDQELFNSAAYTALFFFRQKELNFHDLKVLNNPSNPHAPIFYPCGIGSDSVPQIQLTLNKFSFEQFFLQFVHELTHALFGNKFPRWLMWVNELFACSASHFFLKSYGYNDYLEEILRKYRKEETSTLKLANAFLKSNIAIYSLFPTSVYSDNARHVNCANVMFDLFPSTCDFWKTLKVFADFVNSNDLTKTLSVEQLMNDTKKSFSNLHAEYTFLTSLFL